ncbi:MAG: Na+/H+ antiporter subunit C [Paracoccaceae bacterium]|jgi:multicomponent K+:H+ antiporter subunit C|uniref:Na+/H+ antiporter subunit C n=1 Tax=unclassified Seohaeicola TaxID=2641111 RepID=UPI00237B37F5|nr:MULTISPECIES: Na+/H+ antiporter subunit C [unclassified Seohaeicola]MDD9707654.1 Na+/H+ antiporter subunit C [Seohaeicola sp. 4SK31]MDD9735895.1 Na+/H+ antiporter subunit C [Seohaeicola sp. SP36]MDF1707967.1 Na+/H+ antiporter subunit C [Paracoccaceae bacterium]MDM7968970.1 Na+/H+ antiporter subunit C [Paracoccaceae bacterium]
MEYLLATAIGVMTAAGIYLLLRQRTFPVILGISMLTYAVNLFLFASGRVAINLPPVLLNQTPTYTDPLPQALVLTAIVISFGMTAVVVLMGLGAFLSARTDHIDLARTGDQAEESGK